MHNTVTYQLPHPFAAAAPSRSGMLAYLRAGTLAVWMFTLVVRFWWVSDWFDLVQGEAIETSKSYFYIGFGIALAAHLTLGPWDWIASPFTVASTLSGKLFTAFCILMLMLSPLSLAPTSSALYAVATWGMLAMLCLYWQSDYRIVQRMTVLAGVVVLAWIFALLFKHGLSRGFGSAIGGANRNMTSYAALGGFVLCMLSPRRSIRWAAIASAAFLIVAVTSRGSIVAMAVFLAVYYAASQGSVRAAWHGLLGLSLLGILFLIVPPIRDLIMDDILHLYDARGFSGGFAGRFDYWKQAIAGIWERPFFGHGFRASTHGAHSFGAVHSGYLRLFLDAGFIGGALVIASVVIEGCRRFKLAMQFRSLTPHTAPGIDLPESVRINAVACATLAMSLMIWVYEQLYINLGSVVCVAFFLMLVAPAYITTQGEPVRR